MKILALETSAKSVSAAVAEDGVILAAAYQNNGLTHSRTLMPLVDSMLCNASLTLDDIDLIAVAHGPGSFTKGLPCCGVSTLEAMARGVSDFDGLIVCAMDARRQQIYHALFRSENGQLTRLCDDCAIGLEELVDHLRRLPQPKLVVGDGAQLCYDHLTAAGISCRLASPDHRFQNAAGTALAAADMARTGHTCTAQELQPVYLRLSQAERERLAKGLSLTE